MVHLKDILMAKNMKEAIAVFLILALIAVIQCCVERDAFMF
jgi:hypothetical protein